MDESLKSSLSLTDEEVNQTEVTDGITSVHLHVNKYYGAKHVNVKDSKHFVINLSQETDAANTVSERTFHRSLFGKNVQFYNDNSEAKRICGFSGGLCFINQHLTMENPIFLKITETFYTEHGDCTMGFTTLDPSSLSATGILETRISEAVPGGYNDFFIFKPPLASLSYTGADVFFWRTDDGKVVFKTSRGIEEQYELGIDHLKPMWAFIELNGPLEAVEMIDHELHNVCGTGVTITDEVAERSASLVSQYLSGSHGFICFTQVAFNPDERFSFKVLRVCPAWAGNIRVGVTESSPNLISTDSLPDTVVDDPRFGVVEVNLQHATSNEAISVILHDRYVAIFVNITLCGVIPRKEHQPLWVVVDLFGNTTGVKLVSRSPDIVPGKVKGMGRSVGAAMSPSTQSIHTWWMDCQVLVNTLKDLAKAISAMTQWTAEGIWNYLLRSTHTGVRYVADTFNVPNVVASVGDNLQMLEIGSCPERIRSNCTTIVSRVKTFIEETKRLKQTLISDLHLEQSDASSQDTLTDLLCQFIQCIPEFELQCPELRPVFPSTSEFLLDLSMLPVETSDASSYIQERVSKSLQKTAQKIEHSLIILENCRFKMYTLLDHHL